METIKYNAFKPKQTKTAGVVAGRKRRAKAKRKKKAAEQQARRNRK